MSKYTIGVDVGGTNIKFGLVNSTGDVISRTRLETKSFMSNKDKLIAAILTTIRHILSEAQLSKKQILGIGMGLPGLVDSQKGVVKQLPNIPGWKDVPLTKILKKKLGLPVFIENDVNLITLGEWQFGAGRGVSNLICMTLGTGVGSGLVLDNKLYRGEDFVAGELGHVPINEVGPKCGCGGEACFERYVGNKQILRLGQEYLGKSKIKKIPDIRKLANQGNQKAKKFWVKMGVTTAQGLIGAINLLNPRLIIIGGGVSNNFVLFKKSLNKTIKKRAMKVQGAHVRVVHACLGDDAGIKGAHVLVKEKNLGR